MNIQLANVLSDVSGVTGQAILKAILAGERDPHKLAALRGNSLQFDLRQLLYPMSGVDQCRIDGIGVIAAMTLVAEASYDMSPWPTADHFVSWLRLRLTTASVAIRSSAKVELPRKTASARR